ncbi:AraC family transcriptional regulator [Micromonospora fluostatini]|uniref:AraC family transcriptional regulator n=1 Tax=Micromonospora fluostatini TaxID=1629071 RepID=A0ABY2DG53_9ACTN|nr:AraC family transcriptional regulator [Micromonospora fluostatini]
MVGSVGVGALADELGWSRRHLAATFRREVGLPPKVTARLLRFARAHAALTADRPPGTAAPGGAEVAARYGYSDQSHLIREFHEFAGVTPAALLRSHSSNAG